MRCGDYLRLGNFLEFGDHLGLGAWEPSRAGLAFGTWAVRSQDLGLSGQDGPEGQKRGRVLTKPLQLSQKVGLRKVTSWKVCRKARPSLAQMALARSR